MYDSIEKLLTRQDVRVMSGQASHSISFPCSLALVSGQHGCSAPSYRGHTRALSASPQSPQHVPFQPTPANLPFSIPSLPRCDTEPAGGIGEQNGT